MARARWLVAWLALAGCSPLAVDAAGNGMAAEIGDVWSMECPPGTLSPTAIGALCAGLVGDRAWVALSVDRGGDVAPAYPPGVYKYPDAVVTIDAGEAELAPSAWTDYAVEILSWDGRRLRADVTGSYQGQPVWIGLDVELITWEEWD